MGHQVSEKRRSFIRATIGSIFFTVDNMFRRCFSVLFALLVCTPALARHIDQAFTMTGLTQSGDTAELRFDPVSSAAGKLVILGDRSNTKPQTIAFSYQFVPGTPGATGVPTVQITFADKQSLTIFCDPLSDNCRSTDFITEDGTTFALLWRIARH